MGAGSKNIGAVIDAYNMYFGPPAESHYVQLSSEADDKVAVVVYLPKDPEAWTTQFGTAGLNSRGVGQGFRAELGIEIKGEIASHSRVAIAEALVHLASAPLKTGRPFLVNQVLGNMHLPMFERFSLGMLVDWDPVYGFTFPGLAEPVTLLRVVPLFESEATFIEGMADRTEAYLRLYNSGLVPDDHERGPAR